MATLAEFYGEDFQFPDVHSPDVNIQHLRQAIVAANEKLQELISVKNNYCINRDPSKGKKEELERVYEEITSCFQNSQLQPDAETNSDPTDNSSVAIPKSKRDRLDVDSDQQLNQLEAQVSYIVGRALDIRSMDTHNKKAEELLSKAAKLDPLNVDAWNALGICIWKRQDVLAARDCFLGSLEQRKNKVALRYLSMVLRKAGTTKEEKVKNFEESFTRAKEALALDLKDSESWYILGNTYLSRFFATSHNMADLESALKAYQMSEKTAVGSKSTPDMYFNRAQVYCYLEDYVKAIGDLEIAFALDPSLPAKDKIDEIKTKLKRFASLVANKGKIKTKKIQKIVDELYHVERTRNNNKDVRETQDREVDSIKQLNEGENNGKCLYVKSLIPLSKEPPVSFLAIDKSKNVFALSVYHLNDTILDRVRHERDVLQISDPVLNNVDWDSQKIPIIQIKKPHKFLVNGEILKSSFAHAAMTTEAFDN